MRNIVPIIQKGKSLLITVTILALYFTVSAQTTNVGTWNIVDLYYKFNPHTTLWLETQTRSQNLFTDFYYHELKAGMFYNFPKYRSTIFFGGGRYTTYNFSGNFKSPIATEECRTWEQFTLNNGYNQLNIEHRYRLEQRWINNNFKPRIRYRINPTLAINHPSIIPNTLFLSAFDELFLGNANPHLERNRYYLGLGYQFSSSFTLQMGYLNQTDYNAAGGQKDKSFIQTSLLFYADRKMFKKESKSNSIMD